MRWCPRARAAAVELTRCPTPLASRLAHHALPCPPPCPRCCSPARPRWPGPRADLRPQIYASVVSTLLALMDGVADRGAVVVIGATNRCATPCPTGHIGRCCRCWPSLQAIDGFALADPPPPRPVSSPEGIDPALRRPGRFDREVYFGLPSLAQRTAILRAHTRHWAPPPGERLLARVAAATEGHAGADLRALCCAAVMAAARRAAPALLQLAEAQQGKGQGGAGQRSHWRQRLLEGVTVEPRDWRAALASAPPPCSCRPSLSTLSAAAATPLQPPLLALLVRPLRALLAALHAAGLPLPSRAATAARAAAAGGDAGAFEALLLQQSMPVAGASSESSKQQGVVLAWPGNEAGGSDMEAEEQQACALAHHQHCRLLLAGEGERGQEAAAGALLRLLEGCPTHVVSLPTLVVAGQGDATAGVVALVHEALRQAGPGRPIVLHLPRFEGWVLHQEQLPMECPDEEEEEEGGGGWGCREGGTGARGAVARTPGGATPQGNSTPRRAYPVAPSPFSGLLPLEARGHNTSAMARDMGPPEPSLLRSQQRSRSAGGGGQQQQQQPAGADPGDPGSDPELAPAGQHPLPALPRIRTSISPGDSSPGHSSRPAGWPLYATDSALHVTPTQSPTHSSSWIHRTSGSAARWPSAPTAPGMRRWRCWR